ncbi:Transposon Ty3-G Gag-Pol polyprotein [Araneus ventricosus]|uniref:Transposon Ty3-G Gag-Pol polyprotein n=1 Tax=Araneus ventricosus TaxID=182803 RepID=A0A4Y2IPH9_ARAVE|nr:Transposon Ty3-G Gag-Pol polyprotein [Araneus ventricosus]
MEFQHMLDLGHMRPSNSNYASPLHMVPKKGSDDWLVGDFRALNAQTKKDKYLIPRVLDFTSELHGTKIFSHIDLVKAFHQILIAPEDVHKTAICTPFGLFESTRMQFGFCNASSTFQRFIDEVTRGLHGVYAFIDDILIASQTYEEHIQHLRVLFSRLDHYGLTIKSFKCTFGVPILEFLGFIVSKDGISPIPDRVSAIQDFPRPTTLTQLRRFLGTFSLPDARFVHNNIDFIGPLPTSDGYTYCMTIVDSFTRWPEVIPTTDITAETTGKALIHNWIPRFGCPETITTDQDRNFDSHLFRHLNDILGTNRIRTTSYHPQSNGLVERFHRHLKSSIIAHSQPNWTETLPIVLLGIRSAIKPDINATCAELFYGTTLRLPSDILNSKSDLSTPTDTCISKFKLMMQSINPISTSRHSFKPIYIHPSLQTCSHVFLRVHSAKPPLSPPYTGPHPAISRKEKTFVCK